MKRKPQVDAFNDVLVWTTIKCKGVEMTVDCSEEGGREDGLLIAL